MQNVLLFGASGKLGREIKIRISSSTNLAVPSHRECDITDANQVNQVFEAYKPDQVIHTAALVGVPECEKNKEKAWQINVNGTVNIVKTCQRQGARLVFTSSAVIFNGERGNYSESDVPTPANFYAITKVAAEQAVRVLENSVIVRLDFFPKHSLKYNEVYTDHFASKIAVEEAAEKIIKISASQYCGVINIGRKRESLYNILKPITIASSKIPAYPRDISLDTSIWQKIFGDSTDNRSFN